MARPAIVGIDFSRTVKFASTHQTFDDDFSLTIGKTRRNSGRNGSVFYWWPPKTFKEKGDSK